MTLTDFDPVRRYRVDELLAHLPAIHHLAPAAAPGIGRERGHDRLLAIAPDVYLPVLLGRPLGRDRKVACPWHEDRTPSLHAYPDHWYCFSCRAGGTIYDLAARLSGLTTRGPDFRELRRRLQARFPEPPGSDR